MTRTGLVLGAGGIVGQAYHAGVLAALANDLGWDARTADIIVGSSAGSVTGALLRLGIPPADLAAWAVGAPLSVESERLAPWMTDAPPEFPAFDVPAYLRGWRLPSPALVLRTARRPWAFRASVAAMTMAPHGQIDLTRHTHPLHLASSGAWPQGLYICAARERDGARVSFGRASAPAATLASAVAASCAIPGFFTPVTIGNVRYIDGGVHSPTNADILRSEKLDLVIVVSPMSAAAGLPRTADAPMRYAAHRRLEREIRRLEEVGTKVVRFEPGRLALRAMGINAMASDRSAEVVRESFVETGDVARKSKVAAMLAPIVTRDSWFGVPSHLDDDPAVTVSEGPSGSRSARMER